MTGEGEASRGVVAVVESFVVAVAVRTRAVETLEEEEEEEEEDKRKVPHKHPCLQIVAHASLMECQNPYLEDMMCSFPFCLELRWQQQQHHHHRYLTFVEESTSLRENEMEVLEIEEVRNHSWKSMLELIQLIIFFRHCLVHSLLPSPQLKSFHSRNYTALTVVPFPHGSFAISVQCGIDLHQTVGSSPIVHTSSRW